jgi:hypothetical protein
MPQNRYYAVANNPEDNHGSVTRAIEHLVLLLDGAADCNATIIVPSLDGINNTVVPQVLNELNMQDLQYEREFEVNNSTLTLCSQIRLGRGYRYSQIYLSLFPTADFINTLEGIQTCTTLIVVASEEITRDWRNNHDVINI